MTMIPNAIGRWRARLDWKSTKSAVAPPTRTVAPGGAGMPRIRLMVSLLGSELNGFSRHRLDHGDAVVEPARGKGLGDALGAADPRRQRDGAPRRRALDRDPDRGLAVGREPLADRVVGLAGAGALRQHGRVDGVELDREEGKPEEDQEGGGKRRDRDRPAHHEAREAVPEPVLVGAGVGLGAALEEPRREGVDPGSEQGQDRRQDGQRDQRREQHHQRAAEAHRVEEALGEDEQRRERDRDRHRGEEDGPARRSPSPAASPPGRARPWRSPRGSGRR